MNDDQEPRAVALVYTGDSKRPPRRRGILPITVLGVGNNRQEAVDDARSVGSDLFNADEKYMKTEPLKKGSWYKYRVLNVSGIQPPRKLFRHGGRNDRVKPG